MYPQGERLKGLSDMFMRTGYVQEEANHAGVCVEEIPLSARSEVKEGYETFKCFNERRSCGNDLLEKCFNKGDDVLYGTLSHSHLLLILRAWLYGAKWEIPHKEGCPRYCGTDGCLDLAAVADWENASEMTKSIKEGLRMEVLSYKLDLEEPTGASTISQALNKGQELALRTTELTALSVLTGEVIAQQTCRSQELAYESVREAVRHQLDVIVDEPEFIEMFEFVISMGAGRNSFLTELLDFGSRFVDAKHRQLRLQAFTDVNKMCVECPRVKVAVLKRAYRKKPSYGFCPTPEAKWSKYDVKALSGLEELLHYFHVDLKNAVALNRGEQAQAVFFANVDCAAADAFLQSDAKDVKSKLIDATVKYYTQLSVDEKGDPLNLPASRSWVDFDVAAHLLENTAVAATGDKQLKVKVLGFDENRGKLLCRQTEVGIDEKQPLARIELPWRGWLMQDTAKEQGMKQADMAAAVAVLRTLAATYPVQDERINIWFDPNKHSKSVEATMKVNEGGCLLAPCIPKTSKVSESTEHPHRIAIDVIRKTKPYQLRPAVAAAAVSTVEVVSDVEEGG
jgi:hypothetical protein